MRRPLIVFLGGGLGACARAFILDGLVSGSGPTPVLLINVAGAFALSVVYVLADESGLLHAETRLFLGVGVLGGFTTFSTVGWGAAVLLGGGDVAAGGVYMLLSIVGGVLAVGAGLIAGREAVVMLSRGATRTHSPSGRRSRRTIDVKLDAGVEESREESA